MEMIAGMLASMGLKWISKMLSSIPPEVVAHYINDGKDPLVDAIRYFPDQVMFGKSLARPFSKLLVGLDARRVLEKIREANPMVAGVIMNHPRGMAWLESVLVRVKELVICDDMLCNSCLQPFPLYPAGLKKYACPYCGAEYDFGKSADRLEE